MDTMTRRHIAPGIRSPHRIIAPPARVRPRVQPRLRLHGFRHFQGFSEGHVHHNLPLHRKKRSSQHIPAFIADTVDMEQQRAINALEPFVALSKSATSPRAAADLVTQATSHPHTYVFAELLQTPNIQALRNSPEYSPHLRLLEIFAWGSYAEYLCVHCSLPTRGCTCPVANNV